jgi:hypothetical protein
MLAVLVLQVLSAGLAFSAPPLRDLGAYAAEDHLIVCTAGGMVDLGSADGSVPPSADHGGLCVFCLPLLHGGPAVTAAAVPAGWAVQPPLSAPFAGASPAACLPRQLSGSATPQAPPAA